MQNAGPTLAQLNSPPNNEEFTTLKNFGDLDSLNLDLEALTGDLLSGYPSEVKTEYVPVIQQQQQSSFMSLSTPYGRGQPSLSTSVPTPGELCSAAVLVSNMHIRSSDFPLRLSRLVQPLQRRAPSQPEQIDPQPSVPRRPQPPVQAGLEPHPEHQPDPSHRTNQPPAALKPSWASLQRTAAEPGEGYFRQRISKSTSAGAGPNQVSEQLEPVQVSKASNRSSSTELLVHLQPHPCLSALEVCACEELAPGQLDLEPEGAETAHELHLLHRWRLLHSWRGLRCPQQPQVGKNGIDNHVTTNIMRMALRLDTWD